SHSPPQTRMQVNQGESLTKGINRSKNPLLNDELMNRKSETSSDWNQPIIGRKMPGKGSPL
ncbi:MAG TPA: hypothetical protein VHZ30_07965, partial [Verrucomicrobiae bacterium]|nr:hypothetical protein [Verrucomicrobiae bacterium]